MKTITLTITFLLTFTLQSIGQTNPVNNLTWDHTYRCPYNFFTLAWEEPSLPHDNLIGYNVYRENDFYMFINETSIYYVDDPVLGIISNCGGEDFFEYGDGSGFTAYVTAVYGPNHNESARVAIQTDGPRMALNGIAKNKAILFPNPTSGIINIGNQNLTKIQLFDLSGKMLKEFNPKPSIDLSNFSKGTYFIKLISDEGIMTDRIVVE